MGVIFCRNSGDVYKKIDCKIFYKNFQKKVAKTY